MGQLGRRLDALEQIAEEARLRPIRLLAEERGLPFDAVRGHFERLHAEMARLRAEGLTYDQIVAAKVARMGLSPEELERRCAALRTKLDEIAARS
jgi:hypothetical protein